MAESQNSKGRCIEHPANAYFIAIREDYLLICQDAPDMYCAAAILDRLERWCDSKQRNGNGQWVFMTAEDWQAELRGMYGRNKIIKCLHWLDDNDLLDKRSNPDNSWDKTLQYQLNYQEVNSVLSIVWNGNTDSLELNYREFNPDTLDSLEPDAREFSSKPAIPKSQTKTPNKETSKAAPQTPHRVQALYDFYHDLYGQTLNSNDQLRLKAWVDEFPTRWIEEALQKAKGRANRPLPYAQRILNDWLTDGYDGGKIIDYEPDIPTAGYRPDPNVQHPPGKFSHVDSFSGIFRGKEAG